MIDIIIKSIIGMIKIPLGFFGWELAMFTWATMILGLGTYSALMRETKETRT